MTDIIKTSASAIESFDDSTPFGCERRWYFKSVMKLPEPARENLLLGTNLHCISDESVKALAARVLELEHWQAMASVAPVAPAEWRPEPHADSPSVVE